MKKQCPISSEKQLVVTLTMDTLDSAYKECKRGIRRERIKLAAEELRRILEETGWL